MKTLNVFFLLALCGGSLFAQEVPTVTPPVVDVGKCSMIQPELFLALALSQSQCERISLAYSEVQGQIGSLYEEVNPLNDQMQSLFWSWQVPQDRFAAMRRIENLQNKIWNLQLKIREFEAGRKRNAIGALNERQREFLNRLQAQTEMVRVYGQASGTLIDGYQTMYPQVPVWMQSGNPRPQEQ